MLWDTDVIDGIFSQDTTSKNDKPFGKFQPKAKKKLLKCLPPSSIHSEVSQPNENGVTIDRHSMQMATGSSENTLMIDGSVSFENGQLQSEEENLRPQASFRKDIASASLENDNFQNVSDKGIQKDVQEAGEDRSTGTRQLRKRNSVLVHDYDFEEENNEDSGPFDTQESDKDNDFDDSDYTGEKMPTTEKVNQKSKSLSGEKQKPGRKHRKLSDDASATKKKPVKRNFPHSTRRKRRQVDKLLETPDSEIDERNLPMNVLIPLAEAREKLSMKETPMEKQSNGNNSSGRIFGDHHMDEEQVPDGSLDDDDDDEFGVNPEARPSSTIFNYHSFMDKVRSPRWSKVDTELFYQAIRQFGTDFAMIQQLFPTRTRHQVKLKFKNEERRHPLQIADALTCRSKDNSHFEAVIQRLEAQASQNSSKDSINEGEASEWQDVGVENKKEEVKESEEDDDESEEDGENGLDGKRDQDGNVLKHRLSDAKIDEYQSAFEW